MPIITQGLKTNKFVSQGYSFGVRALIHYNTLKMNFARNNLRMNFLRTIIRTPKGD